MTIGTVGGTPTATLDEAHARLREAAYQLESVFYAQLFQAMRQTVPDSGFIQRDAGEKTFSAMLDEQVAQLATHQTSRGLGESLYRELSRQLPAPERTAT